MKTSILERLNSLHDGARITTMSMIFYLHQIIGVGIVINPRLPHEHKRNHHSTNMATWKCPVPSVNLNAIENYRGHEGFQPLPLVTVLRASGYWWWLMLMQLWTTWAARINKRCKLLVGAWIQLMSDVKPRSPPQCCHLSQNPTLNQPATWAYVY